jgi:urocanate reductase
VYETDSPIFDRAKATGLTVTDWQEVILVNQFGKRFWNELDSGYDYINAAFANHGDTDKLNGGGPIWGIFDADAAARQKWNCKPPNVDPDGWFFTADTVFELAGKIKNPHQRKPMDGAALQETVNRYNWFVAMGTDIDFGKNTPLHPIAKPPFYAAWATPILHDTLTGLRTDTNAQVMDTRGEVIQGLYCAGESQGGFAQHGLGRCLVFGRVAGRHAAQRNS